MSLNRIFAYSQWSPIVFALTLSTACGKSDDNPNPDGGPIDCEANPNNGAPEICDNIDNDCDGDTDEFADMLCGGDCAATPKLNCSADTYPPTGQDGWPEPDDDNSSGGIILDDEGGLTLSQTGQRFLHVWVANTNAGTVSKLDAETGKEVARYPSVISTAVMAHGGHPYNNGCTQDQLSGNCPSRTAVDQHGNAYVANRAFAAQGTVTKYAEYGTEAQKLANCEDRNDNGAIETSTDANNNGVIDGGEFVGITDECILWTVNVGGTNGVPRALAVGLNRDGDAGYVWVGLHGSQRVVALNPDDGAIAKNAANANIDIDTSGFRPYGAVTARDGKIWFTRTSAASLGYVTDNATSITLAPANPDGAAAYGITADRDGNLFTASQSGGTGIAYRYNPASETWTTIAPATPYGTGRGIAVDREYLWVSMSHLSRGYAGTVGDNVLQYKLSDLSLVKHWDAITCQRPIGVGISYNGFVWAVCQDDDKAAFLDPESGIWTSHAVGDQPYTYSDFTGYNLNFIAEDGTYAFVAEGCTGSSEGTRWEGFVISEGNIPAETHVEVQVRSAATQDALADAVYSEAIDVPQIDQAIAFDPTLSGMFLQMKVSLSTDNPDVVPTVKEIQLIKTCTVDVP